METDPLTGPLDMPNVERMTAEMLMTVQDAAYAIVLHRYATACKERDEGFSRRTAAKIAVFAKVLGMAPERTPSELGFGLDFTWPEGAKRQAEERIETSGGRPLVRRLWAAIGDLTVGEIEVYGERGLARRG